MVKIVSDWQFSIDRGPDWLFVKIQPPDSSSTSDQELASGLWSILSKHFTYRLVLEMDEIDRLPRPLIGELLSLQKQIHDHGGMLRLSGLSAACQRDLHASELGEGLPKYESRSEAMLGPRCETH